MPLPKSMQSLPCPCPVFSRKSFLCWGGIHTTSGAASAASLYESHYCTSICVCVFCLRPAGTDFSKRRGPNQKKIFAPLDVLYKGSRNIIFLAWRKNFSKWKKTRKKRKRSKNGKKKKKRGKKLSSCLGGYVSKKADRLKCYVITLNLIT